MERSIEAWEEVQRQGQDLMDRVTQGVTGFIQSQIPVVSPPAFPWTPSSAKSPFVLDEIGGRLGQAGAEIGNYFNGVVHHFFRQLPAPFRIEEEQHFIPSPVVDRKIWRSDDLGLTVEGIESGQRVIDGGKEFITGRKRSDDEDEEEEGIGCEIAALGKLKKPKGMVNITATYNSRTGETESSLVARGDLWRVEASRTSGTNTTGTNTGNESSPLFLVQLGPVLFVRDSTLLLPIHLSKQHLLWYGYDRKNGMHSLCPAIWSKHRRWLLMSMICLNPLACSFMDLQFPNGQVTYVAGEGITSSAFIPLFGGLLQAQSRFPGDTRLSFSCRNKLGTRVTPTIHLPDKSFSLEVNQALAYKRSGILIRPTIQLSVCPTIGGSEPGLHVEVIHSLKEEINIICGFNSSLHPSALTSLSIGRSKWNGYVGNSGIVLSMETPLGNMGRPSFSVQLNGGFEF